MRKLHAVKVGGLTLDGKKIYIQSMLNIPSEDIEGNVRQAAELEKAGCEIVRVSVPDMQAVSLFLLSKMKYPFRLLPISISITGSLLNVRRQVWIRSASIPEISEEWTG